jgi:hypothetical protein
MNSLTPRNVVGMLQETKKHSKFSGENKYCIRSKGKVDKAGRAFFNFEHSHKCPSAPLQHSTGVILTLQATQ